VLRIIVRKRMAKYTIYGESERVYRCEKYYARNQNESGYI